MCAEIFPTMKSSLFLREACGRSVLELLIVEVLEIVVKRTILSRRYLCHCFMKNKVSLVVYTHQLSLKDSLVLSDYSQPLGDEFLVND